ncbi:MAG TPA: amidohydrolase family protein, partial [Gemmatimonadaceae bacterium]|nr:amidohydrolase family protein [Gemmatimonadaceae bacterium]
MPIRLLSLATAFVTLPVTLSPVPGHPSPATGQTQAAAVAITNVSVIPMDRERVLANQTVVVQGGRITSVGPAGGPVPAGATVVDGRGKFLIPGLAEMHAHVPGGQAPPELVERVLSLFVLNGVTTIRSMLGDPLHLRLRAQIASGERLGPRFVASGGPSFSGNSASSPGVAMQLVRDQKAAGYDLLKIHPGVPRAAFDSMAATARQLGIPFAGHVPLDVGYHRALEARYSTIDHIDGFLEAILRDGAPVTSAQSQFFGINLVEHVDEAKIVPLARATRAAGVAIVPTEGFLVGRYGTLPADSLVARPEMRYWLPNQVNQWANDKRNTDAQVPAATRARFLELRRKVLKALQDEGVLLLLGSDAPQLWDVPGFSIPRELGYYVDAGLTPYQALATGTINVARFFGWEAESGTIAQGKR